MKHNLFFVTTIVVIVLASSCGAAPKGQYYVPETASPTAKQEGLPETAVVNLRQSPYVTNAFKTPQNVGIGGLDDFYAKTRGKVQHIAIVSGNSLDVLKTFVVKGWTPIVMIKLQGRSPEILPMSGYNDRSGEITLQNPVNFGERRLSYKNFKTFWSTGSANKCVLITAQQLTETDVLNVLKEYLPTNALEDITVRSR